MTLLFSTTNTVTSQTTLVNVGVAQTDQFIDKGNFTSIAYAGGSVYSNSANLNGSYSYYSLGLTEVTYTITENLSNYNLLNFNFAFHAQNGADSVKLFVDNNEIYSSGQLLNTDDNVSYTFPNNTIGGEVKLTLYCSVSGGKSFKILTINGIDNTSTSGINEDISDDFNIFSYNKNLIVKTEDYSSTYRVTVYNMNGQVVMNELSNGYFEKSLSTSNGVYIVNITSDKGSLTKKISLN